MTLARAGGFALGGPPAHRGPNVSAAEAALSSASAASRACRFATALRCGPALVRSRCRHRRARSAETPCRAGRRMGGVTTKTIPAPNVAFGTNTQPLPGLQPRHQRRTLLAHDDADLRQAARQLATEVRRQRLDALRQRGIALGHAGIGPAHRRRRIDQAGGNRRRGRRRAPSRIPWQPCIVTDGSAATDSCSPPLTSLEIVRASVSSRCTRLLYFVERRAGGFQHLARGDMVEFAGLGRQFRLRQSPLRGTLWRRRARRGRPARIDPPAAAGRIRGRLM